MGFMRDIYGSFNINPLFSPCSSLSGDTNSSVRPNFSSIFPKIFNLQMCYIHHWKGILNSFCSLYYIKSTEKMEKESQVFSWVFCNFLCNFIPLYDIYCNFL